MKSPLQRKLHQFAKAIQAAGFSLRQHQILLELQDQGELSTSELAPLLGISKAAVTSHLDAMVAQGFVIRRLHPDDRRSWLVQLSPSGISLLAQLEETLLDTPKPRGCAACDRGDFQLGHAEWCKKSIHPFRPLGPVSVNDQNLAG